jgi:hypothetical protein
MPLTMTSRNVINTSDDDSIRQQKQHEELVKELLTYPPLPMKHADLGIRMR